MAKVFPVVLAAIFISIFALESRTQSLRGTLVVAVPVKEGLVVCSDKRLYDHKANTFTDTFVKIHRVNNNALFVATNTIGFLDKKTGKMGFDVFRITSDYASRHTSFPQPVFWDGLKKEIRSQLLSYLFRQDYKEWPETDFESNKLLFNLVFYSMTAQGARGYTLKVFYEKARTPVVYVSEVVSENVMTPKLSGKGRAVINYVSRDSRLSTDPSILRFDQANFEIQKISTVDAVEFAAKLFSVTSSALPQARVSVAHDCALLDNQKGFRWIDASWRPVVK